jgi:hypothetical protein
MRHRLFVFASLVLGMAAGLVQAAESDPKAVALADKVIEALGGEKAWAGTRYLRFDWAVERGGKTLVKRSHTWDKYTGAYRLEGTTKDGKPYSVVMNLNTRDGKAVLGGKALAGDALKKQLESAYEAWVNDTYWLIMPYKMKDPGVVLAMDGAEKTADGEWDKVRLSFESVGLTPKDRYWAYVNRKTGLVDRWDFILQDEKGPASTFSWKGWKKYGGVMLADDRVSPKDGTRIYFPLIEVPASIPEATFTTP